MALWRCLDCRATFAVGMRMCPQCTSERAVEVGSEQDPEVDMPKTTVSGGPSDASQPNQPYEGGEQGWDGTSSSASTEKQPTNGEPSSQSDQSPAPTTENPSETDPTESSTAPSTDGETPADDRRSEYEGWSKPDLQDELERRDLPITGNKPELVDRLLDYDAGVRGGEV